MLPAIMFITLSPSVYAAEIKTGDGLVMMLNRQGF